MRSIHCLSVFLSFPASWPGLHLIHISYAYLTEQGINATLCNIDDVYSTPLTRCPTVTLCQTPLSLCVWRVCCVANKCISGGTGGHRTLPVVRYASHRIGSANFYNFSIVLFATAQISSPPLTLPHITSLLSCGCPLRHTTGHSREASVGTWHAAIRGDFL